MGDVAEERAALDQLFSLTYEELKRRAAGVRKEFPKASLSPTAIVDECWAKLAKTPTFSSLSPLRFRGLAAHAMRQVLVDAALHKQRIKRGGEIFFVTLDAETDQAASSAEQFLEVHEALERLARLNADQARAVVLRYFAGMTTPEIAEFMDKSESSVERLLRAGLAWLDTILDPER